MSKYTAKPFTVGKPQAEIAEKFSDLTALKPMLEQLPEEQRKQVGDIELDKDSIALSAAQMGKVTFRVASLSPSLVQLKAEGTPVPMALEVALQPIDAASTSATCGIDIDLPALMRPMVGPYLQQAVDKFAEVIAKSLG